MVAIKIFSVEYTADGVKSDPAAIEFYPRVDCFGMVISDYVDIVYQVRVLTQCINIILCNIAGQIIKLYQHFTLTFIDCYRPFMDNMR